MKHTKPGIRAAAALILAAMLLAILPQAAFAEDYSAVVTEKSVAVYTDKALKHYAGSLKKGDVVVVEASADGVVQIKYKNNGGFFCKEAALTDVAEIGKSAFVNASGVKVYEKPDSKSKSLSVEKGMEVTVLATDDSWALIEKDGYGLYMYKGYLTLSETDATPAPGLSVAPGPDLGNEIPAIVTVGALPVYKSASESSQQLTSLKFGTDVTVVVFNPTWAYIYKDGVYGYCATSGLTKASAAPAATPEPTSPLSSSEASIPCMVSVDSAKAYASASTSAKVLATLDLGTKVNVLEYNATWAKVERGGVTGYMKTASLTKVETTPQPTATPAASDAIPCVVSASSVKVYKKASTSSGVMTTLKKGTEVNVLRYNSSWAEIEKNGYVGYCNVKALTRVTDQPTPTPSAQNLAEEYRSKYPDVKFTATVIYQYAPVFTTKDTSSPAAKLDLGTEVDVYAYNSNWAYIGIGNGRAFVAAKYLSVANYTPLKSGDNDANVTKLQQALEKLGYFDGKVGSNYGSLTTSAVRRFQDSIGVSQTGEADLVTLRILYGGYAPESSLLSASISSGASGTYVERIQTRLYYLGYFSKASSIDGSFGSTTVAAVKLFQDAAGMSADGVLSSATLRALYDGSAPSLPSGKTTADYTPSSSGNSEVLKIPAGLESTQVTLPSGATRAEKIEYVIYIAQCQLGKPYIYATAGPNSFDCSGFTVYAFRKINISLGRSAYAQGYQDSTGTKIERIADLKRGDIVCFNTIADSDLSDHVGIYLGSGYFIHASSGSGNGRQVCISNLNSGYYNRVFSWGRRPL